MMWVSLATLLLFAGCVFAQNKSDKMDANHEPPMLGVHWAKGQAPQARTTSSPDMTNHGGTVMTSTYAETIFWGTSWGTNAGDKISSMDTWYSGFGGSNYAGTSNEYTGSNGQVTSSVSYGGHSIDTSKASGGSNTSTILAEACKMAKNIQTNGYYAVYTDLPRKGNYCAWHSWGSCNGVNVQFAFFWKLDGDSGCDPQTTITSYSQGAAALANVSGHELSEARTDPRGDGWFDGGGAENGDKCAWSYEGDGIVTFKNGSTWKIQGEWSNHAYDTNSGYPNRSGQNGCLQGK